MGTPWKKDTRTAGKLKVFNNAGAWKSVVASAMASYDRLGFGIALEAVQKESDADVVVMMSEGSATYSFEHPYYGNVSASTNFDAAAVHGKTIPFIDPDKKVMFKAAVFLPGRLTDVSVAVKEVVIIHEFVHASGLSSNSDHDTSDGLFYSPLEKAVGKLREWGTGDKMKPMPPLRVGNQTRCRLKGIWTDNAGCD